MIGRIRKLFDTIDKFVYKAASIASRAIKEHRQLSFAAFALPVTVAFIYGARVSRIEIGPAVVVGVIFIPVISLILYVAARLSLLLVLTVLGDKTQ